jgi:2,4-dienoyl-CoA reductase (NADPH2)
MPLGRKIAVIGGGAVGLETAHFLAAKGTINPETLYFLFTHKAESNARLRELVFTGSKEVTVFELMPRAGRGVGKSSIWGLINNLTRRGVKIFTEAKVVSVGGGLVTYEKDGIRQSLPFDNIINATGARPVRKVADLLGEIGIPYAVVGDSVRPATIMDAIHEAYLAVFRFLQ